jgi:hypothetical protein
MEEVRRQKGTRMTALKWLFLCSGTALAGLLSVKGSLIWVIVGIPVAVLALFILIFRLHFLERAFSSFVRWRAALSLILATYAANAYAGIFYTHLQSLTAEVASPLLTDVIGRFGAAFTVFAGVASVLALFVYLYWFLGWFLERMRDIFCFTDAVERWYLPAALLVFALVITLVYANTDVFYSANAASDNVWDKVDIVYSSDSSALNEQNVFYNIGASENDIRQPLFGAFAAPFALGASLVARLLLIPEAYSTLLQIVQSVLLALSLMLVVRMIGVSGPAKALTLVCFSLLYPTMLYLLNMEQYIFAVFWLILLLWMIVRGDVRGRDTAWIAATGSMLTSGVFLLLVPAKGSLRSRLKDGALALGGFVLAGAVLGRTAMVLSSAASIRFLMQFTGEKLPFVARLMQYVQFAASCLIAPAAQIEQYANGVAVYHQTHVSAWSIPGMICLAAAIAGFVVNRKRFFAQICAGWVAFSFLLLCALGWGTSEHALVLYTHYFSWAFVSLIVMLLTRMPDRMRALQLGVLSVGALALAVVNLGGIAQIVRFGLAYYPLR